MDFEFESPWPRAEEPGRAQHLFVNLSKHLFCKKDGTLGYQKTPLDPRISKKCIIRRCVLFDPESGLLYGEIDLGCREFDLVGFLSRAWAEKPGHLMRGFPIVLRVSQSAQKEDWFAEGARFLWQNTDILIDELPRGFAAGVHAVRQFDSSLDYLMAMMGKNGGFDIVLSGCAAISMHASAATRLLWETKWKQIEPPGEAYFEKVDSRYEPFGAWRQGPYAHILNDDWENDPQLHD